ncbi:MAG: DUF1080 domain-containing protein [Caldilineaceae bacterium]|nr:DUF1080 domain-containing protein [Caldilineaceae bacterium]
MLCSANVSIFADESKPEASENSAPVPPAARIDGTGPGWKSLGKDDFVNVNCDENTWSFPNGEIHCTGSPVGVIRTQNQLTNLELVIEWRHMKSAGNSGVFLWASEDSLTSLKRGGLPAGIEVQVLDHGYAEKLSPKRQAKNRDWFTTNGDVFPTGNADMVPFPPVAPNGKRSFPSKNLSRGVGEWNHYYIRAVNGEVRQRARHEGNGEDLHRAAPIARIWSSLPVSCQRISDTGIMPALFTSSK